jgi:hypothetical protein
MASAAVIAYAVAWLPRQSPYVIALTPSEREALEKAARSYTSPYCDVIRAKIILLAAENVPNDVIAFRLDIPRQIVTKWRKRFHVDRMVGLQALPRRGRPVTR